MSAAENHANVKGARVHMLTPAEKVRWSSEVELRSCPISRSKLLSHGGGVHRSGSSGLGHRGGGGGCGGGGCCGRRFTGAHGAVADVGAR